MRATTTLLLGTAALLAAPLGAPLAQTGALGETSMSSGHAAAETGGPNSMPAACPRAR